MRKEGKTDGEIKQREKLRVKINILLFILLVVSAKAQVSKTINATLDTLITSLPPIHKEKLKLLYEDIAKSGLYTRLDTTKYDTMYFKYSICFLDTNDNQQEYYFQKNKQLISPLSINGIQYMLPIIDSAYCSEIKTYLLKTNKNLKAFQSLNYDKPQETGTGCICYTGLRLLRIKMRAKRRLKRELRHTYQIQINVINNIPFVSVQIPARNPHFKVHVNCGKF